MPYIKVVNSKMLYFERYNGIKLLKLSMLMLLCYVVSACGMYNVQYIDRDSIKSVAFAGHKPHYKSGESKPTRLGALHFSKKDAAKDAQGRMFLLQRKRGVYMTETKIGESEKRRYFLSIGVNPKTQDPSIGFRMEF